MRRHLITALAIAAVAAGVLALTRVQREREYQQLILDGDRALARSDIAAAIEAFSGASTLKPDAMLAYLKRGNAYRKRGEADLEPALRDLRNAASLDPTAPGPHEGVGDVYLARANYQLAIEAYMRSLTLDERSAPAHYLRGLSLLELRRLPEAHRAFQQALTSDPTLTSAREELAEVCRQLG